MTVGILGGGQLARMLALAGYPLGLDVIVFSPVPDGCARVCEQVRAPFDDAAALRAFAERVDVVTYEFENVPTRAVEYLSAHVAVQPPPAALAAAGDRLSEKRLFADLGIATPAFARVDTLADLKRAVAEIGLPAVLKTRTEGYDGRGQVVLRRSDDLGSAWRATEGRSAVLERFVPFAREVSVIAVRAHNGETAFYPLVTNTHQHGVLRLSRCIHDDPLQAQADDYATRLLVALEYVGVLVLEMFEYGGTLFANEFAPRVHNSGHWTVEGAETSQFENHLRAITGLPLGNTAAVGHSAMVNLIGELPSAADVLAVPGAHLHLYHKERRPGRKLGHVTVRAGDERELCARVDQLRSAIPWLNTDSLDAPGMAAMHPMLSSQRAGNSR